MFRAFSLKNILRGIFLGLLVVGGWLYYPELAARFGPSIPESRQEAKALIRQQKEIVRPHIENIATGLGEIKESIVSSMSEDIKVPEKPRDGFPDIERHEQKAPEKKIPTYFAEEESQWRDLLKRTIHPDQVDAYPYQECFREWAS
jgi:hypothetical protein